MMYAVLTCPIVLSLVSVLFSVFMRRVAFRTLVLDCEDNFVPHDVQPDFPVSMKLMNLFTLPILSQPLCIC